MNFGKLSEWIDPALAVRIMRECGAETLEIGGSIFRGTYRRDGKVIRINPDADFDRMIEALSPRFGFRLTRRDCFLITFFHEAKHCLDDDLLPTMDPIERENGANDYSVERFLRWKETGG